MVTLGVGLKHRPRRDRTFRSSSRRRGFALLDYARENRCSKQTLRKSAVQCESEACKHNPKHQSEYGISRKWESKSKRAHDPHESSAILARATTSASFHTRRWPCIEHVVLSKSEKDIDTEIIDSSSFYLCSTFLRGMY